MKSSMEKPFSVAARTANNPRSGIREIFTLANEKAAQGETVYRLMIGVPDAKTPDTVIEGTIAALHEQKTQYTANAGISELREAIARQVNNAHQLSVQADQVIVVPGAMAGLLFANFTIEAGKQILIPTPGYPNYKMQAGLTGLNAVHYRLAIENGFQPDLDELARLVESGGKDVGAILINTPGNPTGTVFNKDTIIGISRIAMKYGVPIISDEVYKDILLDDTLEHISPAQFAPDHTLLVGALSKKYAMTGMRIGFLIVPKHAIRDTELLGEATISCAPSICQWGGLAGLEGDQAQVAEYDAQYRKRRDVIVSILAEAGLKFTRPSGAFYMMVDIGDAGLSSRDFALQLLEEKGVGVAFGSDFGPADAKHPLYAMCDRLVRIAFCSGSMDTLRIGTENLCEFYMEKSTASGSTH